jgi:hypothetical protein
MDGTKPIDHYADIIDSREVLARIDHLQESADEIGELDQDEADELAALKALASEAADYAADWQCGETLIRDSYFQTYAQELAEDIGAIDPAASWPLSCIDWEQAARELQMDYTSVDFDGITYWVR